MRILNIEGLIEKEKCLVSHSFSYKQMKLIGSDIIVLQKCLPVILTQPPNFDFVFSPVFLPSTFG